MTKNEKMNETSEEASLREWIRRLWERARDYEL